MQTRLQTKCCPNPNPPLVCILLLIRLVMLFLYPWLLRIHQDLCICISRGPNPFLQPVMPPFLFVIFSIASSALMHAASVLFFTRLWQLKPAFMGCPWVQPIGTLGSIGRALCIAGRVNVQVALWTCKKLGERGYCMTAFLNVNRYCQPVANDVTPNLPAIMCFFNQSEWRAKISRYTLRNVCIIKRPKKRVLLTCHHTDRAFYCQYKSVHSLLGGP